MKTNDKEIRSVVELRSADSNTIEGYAVVFDSESQWLGFYEKIAPSAITEETLKRSDVFANLDHDTDKVLARSRYGKGNLTLTIDERGLKFSFKLLDNELARTVKSYVDAGIISSCSFAFTVAEDGDTWERDEDGIDHRTITKIDRLFDVSLVYEPAYLETSVSCRSYERYLQGKDDEIQALCEEILKLEEKI